MENILELQTGPNHAFTTLQNFQRSWEHTIIYEELYYNIGS